MRKRADLFEPGGGGPAEEFVHDPATEATTSGFAGHDHRPHFGDALTEPCQLRARKYLVVLDRDDESMHVDENFSELARQKMTVGEMLVDQVMNGIGVTGACRSERDWRVRETTRADPESRIPLDFARGAPDAGQRQQHQACTSASTVANTSSRMSTARSRSAASMV